MCIYTFYMIWMSSYLHSTLANTFPASDIVTDFTMWAGRRTSTLFWYRQKRVPVSSEDQSDCLIQAKLLNNCLHLHIKFMKTLPSYS